MRVREAASSPRPLRDEDGPYIIVFPPLKAAAILQAGAVRAYRTLGGSQSYQGMKAAVAEPDWQMSATRMT